MTHQERVVLEHGEHWLSLTPTAQESLRKHRWSQYAEASSHLLLEFFFFFRQQENNEPCQRFSESLHIQ